MNGSNRESGDRGLRVPPHSKEAEASVLGGVLLRNDALHQAAEFLNPDDFYLPSHKQIFKAMLELDDAGKPIDPVSLESQLKSNGDLKSSGGLPYLAELSNRIPTAENIHHYVRIVSDKSMLRRLIRSASEIVSEAFSDPADTEAFFDKSEQTIFDVTKTSEQSSFKHVKPVVTEVIRKVTLRGESDKKGITGVPTGFYDLDKMTGGFQPGDLVVLAARPGMGKTSLALNIAQNAGVHFGMPVLFFSLEMNDQQLVERMLCSEARVNLKRFRLEGDFEEDDWLRITETAGQLHKAPIYIDDTPMVSALQVRNKARRFRANSSVFSGEEPLGLIVVDYLQLMSGSSGRSEGREREIAEISRGLKAMAKELKVPVIALSQLNRMVESREDKRPRLSDLRESGAIEQDADIILFIYRDAVYKRRSDEDVDAADDNSAELIIGKHRNGPTGEVKLVYLQSYTRFENPTYHSDEEYGVGGPPVF